MSTEGKKSVNIIMVDDHPIVTEGIKSLLMDHPCVDVLATFNHGLPCLPFLASHNVDIVLLDISLPDVNGIDLCLQIKSQNPKTYVIALSNHAERSIIVSIMQNGASGYMLKNSPVDEIKKCIINVLKGKLAFTQAVKEIIEKPALNQFKKPPKITKREKEILALIDSGKTSMDIAEILFLSLSTVETHRHNLFQKFGAKNAIELLKLVKEQVVI
ncbi:response regulator transcription factor [Pedobacter heparinus]|uniref:response regulator transcription factor n=1 Tax=Pedobacter heparinus TaxID=984 RepID=UPI00292E387D|nr:response regulator transcription factor [Pedobacter heparinus]